MKWFTADTHFDHEKLLASRPRFSSIEEMNAVILEGINRNVQRSDELFILGDYCWNKPGSFRNKINCRKVHLIWGNHDKENYGQHFSEKHDVKMIKVGEHSCWLSHYPHCFWPSSHHGSFHLYGHMHYQRELWMNYALGDQRRSMDVGVDSINAYLGSYRPISE
jgi:calcineurin-like phosphoesterase family protein